MKREYICSICGETFSDMNEYGKHVVECLKNENEKMKAEEDAKRLEKVNAAINRVKKAEEYYNEQLDKFKNEFPKEYEINFGKNSCKCNKSSYSKKITREDYPELFNLLDIFGFETE